MVFCHELHNPKRNYENQIRPWAPKDVIIKKVVNITTCHWTIQADGECPHKAVHVKINVIQISSRQMYFQDIYSNL